MSLELRDFNITEADWARDGNVLSNIRKLVFIIEQQVPQDEEWDGRDDSAWHWVATDPDERPIGTARLLPDGQIGRMAVLGEYRARGIGFALLEAAVQKARTLGMNGVYLNAQTHALGFYERAGFVAEGDEFMEAGIPHYRMTQSLTLPDDDVTRIRRVDDGTDISIREFDTTEAEWSRDGKLIRKLRETTLVNELGLSRDLIALDEDEDLIHWQTRTPDDVLIGSIGMTVDGTLMTLCVDSSHRGKGVGHSLIEQAVAKARRFKLPQLRIAAGEPLRSFLSGLGFQEDGDAWSLILEPPEPAKVVSRGQVYQTDDSSYQLGRDNDLLLIRTEDEMRNVIETMAGQATHYLRILSPFLEHRLFDTKAMQTICSNLARRNKRTHIEILIYESHRVIKNGHVLLELSRRLPSSISIKLVHPELRVLNNEYVIADERGFIYRQNCEIYEGQANFNNITEASRLLRQFQSAWNSSLYDANLRQLRI
ncbi:MAG: GNAT family N-acetyltransferase [Pseudomonadota bacterium]